MQRFCLRGTICSCSYQKILFSVYGSQAGQTLACLFCITCLSPQQFTIVNCFNSLILKYGAVKSKSFRMLICWRNTVITACKSLIKRLIFLSILQQYSNVSHRRSMVSVMKAGTICKMSVFQTNLICFFIH